MSLKHITVPGRPAADHLAARVWFNHPKVFLTMFSLSSATVYIPKFQGEESWAYIINSLFLRPLRWMDRPPEIFHSIESNNPTCTILPGCDIFMHLQEQTKLNIIPHFVYPPLRGAISCKSLALVYLL